MTITCVSVLTLGSSVYYLLCGIRKSNGNTKITTGVTENNPKTKQKKNVNEYKGRETVNEIPTVIVKVFYRITGGCPETITSQTITKVLLGPELLEI